MERVEIIAEVTTTIASRMRSCLQYVCMYVCVCFTGESVCDMFEFKCYDANHTEICLPKTSLCNGIVECDEGSDEINCPRM